jgi:hypothetical protein
MFIQERIRQDWRTGVPCLLPAPRSSLQVAEIMNRPVRVAVRAANLIHELRAELSNPDRSREIVWRFRTIYHPQLAELWHEASLMPGILEQNFLPASVQVMRIRGLQPDFRAVYTMTEMNGDNAHALLREVIDKLQWLAQYALELEAEKVR